jgi:hypothetical protein
MPGAGSPAARRVRKCLITSVPVGSDYNAILLGSEFGQFGIRSFGQAGGLHIQDVDGGFAALQAAKQVSVDVFVRQEADAQGCLACICLRAS